MSPPGAHAAVGDDVAVLAGLQHVLGASGRDVGDRGRLRDAEPEDSARGARGAGADAHQDADGAGAHQVEAGRVGGAAAGDDRDRHLGDELLEVERLGLGRDVLGRDHGALDHEDVEARLERDLVEVGHALRGERAGCDDARFLDLLDPLGDQLGLDGLLVDLLHELRGAVGRRRGDPLELLVRVLVARPDALEVEDAQAAELAEADRRRGGDDAVHGRSEQRQLEAVGAEVPRDVDVVGVARPARGHDRDVVEPVGPPALLAPTDLDFHPFSAPYFVSPQARSDRGRKKPLGKGLETRILRNP